MKFESGEWREDPVVQPQAQPVQQPEKKIVAVLPFIEKELEQVKDFLNRSNDLCDLIPRTIYLLPFKGIDTTVVRKAAERSFTQVEIIQDSEGKTSDWQGRERIRDAAGPNSLFRQAVWWFYLKQKSPWLWLEPDCWPIGDRWFQDIEQEYFDAAKPFMGTVMEVPNGMRYMNGVGVYPWNAVQYAPLLAQAAQWAEHPEFEVGFDVAGGKDVLSKAHITRKIQLVSHLARGNVEVRPETVLCHGRIDLSGAKNVVREVALQDRGSESIDPTAQKPFLDRYGVARDAQTEVFGDASPHAAPCVPSHETESTASPVQESILSSRNATDVCAPSTVNGQPEGVQPATQKSSSQSRHGGNGYGELSQAIRWSVENLVSLWDQQPHRKVLIVKELRKAKLVPKHFR